MTHSPHLHHPGDSESDPAAAYVVPADRPVGAGAAARPGAATTPAQVLYLTEPGDTAPISVTDLYQGTIGDCFLLSSIGELAATHPTAIRNMIHANSNGTETVTLYTDRNGHLPTPYTTAFKPVTITITNTFPADAADGGASQDVAGNQKEIWPQVLEKAVATLDGGYAAISNGGSPVVAMEELTGHAASWMSPSGLTSAKLQGDIASGDLITMDTLGQNSLPYNLVPNHAYMVDKLIGSGAGAMVQLRNPWGFDQPAAIPLAQLSKGIAEVDVGSVG